MDRRRFSIALLSTSYLIGQFILPQVVFSAPEPITETLLQQPSGAPTAGRLWPGFAAAQGLDTGAQADPSGPKPEQIDTGATADPAGPPPSPLRIDLSPGGVSSGGDLSASTVPWMGSGAAAPTAAATEPLVGGVPTSGGISLGGGDPLGAGTSLPNFGNLAAGMLDQTMSGIPGMSGLSGVPGAPNVPGLQGLGNTMGFFGMLAILNSLPQMIAQLPQFITQLPRMFLDSIQSIGQMFLSLFQLPQMLWQSLTGMGAGLMGEAGQLGQALDPSEDPRIGLGGGDSPSPPTVIIGVGHEDKVSAAAVESALKSLSKSKYTSYGVEMPKEHQPGVDAFMDTYKKTGSMRQAKEAFWNAIPEELRAGMGTKGYEGVFDRMTLASKLGMSVKAIDAPYAVVEANALKISALAEEATALGSKETLSGFLDSVKAAGTVRNGYMANAITPGMVVEVGASHTGGPGSLDYIATSSGGKVVVFDALGKTTVVPVRPGETVINRPPNSGFFSSLLGGEK